MSISVPKLTTAAKIIVGDNQELTAFAAPKLQYAEYVDVYDNEKLVDVSCPKLVTIEEHLAWHGMVDACDGYLAAEASGSSFG